jgi:hypothetical protein
MDFLNDPKTLHYTALNMWANWLETSDPTKPASRVIYSVIFFLPQG